MNIIDLLGVPAHLRPSVTRALSDAGFPRPDIEAWLNAWTLIPEPGLVLAEATYFDDHGIPLAEALRWHLEGFLSGDACCYYDSGYTPEQAATVRDLAEYEFEVDEWLATGLPADRVIAYLHAAVELDEVPAFETATCGPTGPVGMLAALLG